MRVKKQTHYICDICGNEIKKEYLPIGVYRKERFSFEYEYNGRKKRNDMCRKCYDKFIKFVKEGD